VYPSHPKPSRLSCRPRSLARAQPILLINLHITCPTCGSGLVLQNQLRIAVLKVIPKQDTKEKEEAEGKKGGPDQAKDAEVKKEARGKTNIHHHQVALASEATRG
jgi:hypothetical protein